MIASLPGHLFVNLGRQGADGGEEVPALAHAPSHNARPRLRPVPVARRRKGGGAVHRFQRPLPLRRPNHSRTQGPSLTLLCRRSRVEPTGSELTGPGGGRRRSPNWRGAGRAQACDLPDGGNAVDHFACVARWAVEMVRSRASGRTPSRSPGLCCAPRTGRPPCGTTEPPWSGLRGGAAA